MAITTARTTMNGKPVLTIPAKGVINFKSGFAHKLLCDGPTFSTGTACAYSCSFCYVPSAMLKLTKPLLDREGVRHEDVVIRRGGALKALRNQLFTAKGLLRFNDPNDRRVIYSSPLVDVAANVELVNETVDACRLLLDCTHWQIRLLSKSNLLPMVARQLFESHPKLAMERMIFGVSTGTLNDALAKAFEEGTPLVSKRIASLHKLQDDGWRTFGMVCPSLPCSDYDHFAREAADTIRVDKCEHIWAEVINVRGESMTRTVSALRSAGFEWEADELARVSTNKEAWEAYARRTFLAHTRFVPTEKLRFLQYVNNGNRPFWSAYDKRGAILL